jgi:hypothetical protein
MTLPISVDPALLGSASAVEGAGAATMAGVGAGAAPAITAVLPAGVDSVSTLASTVLSQRGAATIAALTEYVTQRQMFASTVGLSGASYGLTELLNTVALTVGA